MQKFKVNCLVIGGGVSGLAISRNLSKHFKNIFLIEKNNHIGQETSSRNSEVIHAGIYYEKDSLKARLCIEGRKLLYEYLATRKINFLKCGKFIVSTSDSETEELYRIQKNAKECGVNELLPNSKAINEYSFLKTKESLFSPSTGIFDSHSYMVSLKQEFEGNGGVVLLSNNCLRVEQSPLGFEILIKDSNTQEEFKVITKVLVNCAGLGAVEIANNLYEEKRFRTSLLKGDYYSYRGKEKLNHLIYPIPDKNSLGIHATLDLGRGIKFGPSAYEVDEVDYSINDDEKNNFYNSIKSYWPTIEKENLVPDYSGIRSIIKGSNDFVIDIGNFDENICFNILGYVSPGLTCSLSLAKYIEANLQDF